MLAIKILETNFINKIRYSLHGVIISQVTDRVVNNLVLRSSGDKQIVIDGNKVVSICQNIKIKPIEKPKFNALFVENRNIGVIDIETYRANDDTFKIYALGFKTNLAEKSKIYYIDKSDLDSRKIVLELVEELLRPKYANVTFYCHNLGGYDIVFLLKTLYTYNDENQDNKYKISTLLRDDKIIKVKISKDKKSFIILDSYAMLADKLIKLGKNFGVATIKSKFPYKFAIQDHLFYEGAMPSIEYYEGIKDEEYKDMSVGYWSFYDETIRYLNNDLHSLHEILTKANKQVFLDYNVNMKEHITISGLAVSIFLKDFYNNNIPTINKASIYKDIKQAYCGGITEVYKPLGRDLFYYDVNSLYPSVASQDMPGLTCSKIFFYDENTDIDTLFGFFYCSIDAPLNGYLGLLPIRTVEGLIFPLGKWEGWYFSEELKFAKKHGYKIKVFKGYSFSRETNVFTKYVDKVYDIKSKPINASQKAMAKSLLNNLLGRFGINLEKPVTEVLSYQVFDQKMLMHKIISYKEISNEKVLVCYVPKLDYEIINSHNLDFIKIVNKYNDKELQPLSITSIVISAAITAYARIHMSKLKLEILNRGGELYYSDTDSIVTNLELPNSMVSPNKLGLLKLEHVLYEAIFISNKLYWMCDVKGNSYILAKGIESSSLSYTNFIQLLNNKNIKTGIKRVSKSDWELGHVLIEDKYNITIHSNSYTKRVKIYNNHDMWIDTKPIFINKIVKDLVVYKQEKDLIVYQNVYVNKSNINVKSIFNWILIISIIFVSSIAYLLTLQEGEFNLYEPFLYHRTNDDEESKVNIKDNPFTEGDSKVNNNVEIIVDQDSSKPYIEDDLNSLVETNTKFDTSTTDPIIVDKNIPKPKKTLYQGFLEELSKIQNTENSRKDESVTDESTKGSLLSPTTTENSNNTTNTTSTSYPSPDYSKDKFSPNTLVFLDAEIRRNSINLETLTNVCKDPDTKTSINETLLEERKYLLEQKSKHLNSILQEASNTPLNDTDVDNMCKEISQLKTKVDNLYSKSENFKDRSLNSNEK